MGIVRALGVGGGVLRLELASTTVEAGGELAGKAIYTAGKRAEELGGISLRMVAAQGGGGGGGGENLGEREIIRGVDLSGPFRTEPGRTYTFPFSVSVPLAACREHHGGASVRYRLIADAYLPGPIESRADVDVVVQIPGF